MFPLVPDSVLGVLGCYESLKGKGKGTYNCFLISEYCKVASTQCT